MEHHSSTIQMNKNDEMSLMLSEILNEHARETISEKQVQRLLRPVIKMINEGRFDKPFFRSYKWLLQPAIAVAAVIGVLLVVMKYS